MLTLTCVSIWNYNTNYSTAQEFNMINHDDAGGFGHNSGRNNDEYSSSSNNSNNNRESNEKTKKKNSFSPPSPEAAAAEEEDDNSNNNNKKMPSTITTTEASNTLPYSYYYTFHGQNNTTYPSSYFVEQYPNPTYKDNDWIFQSNQYCTYSINDKDDGGSICDEVTYLPYPRTKYSIQEKNYFHYVQWWNKHYKLRNDYINFYQKYYDNKKQQQAQRQENDPRPRRPIIFLGDSIFETYKGTWYDLPIPQLKKFPNFFRNTLTKAATTTTTNNNTNKEQSVTTIDPTNPLVIATCGDHTQHLFYNMIHTLFFNSINNTSNDSTSNNNNRRRSLEHDVDRSSNNNNKKPNDDIYHVPPPTHIPDLTTLMKEDPDTMNPIFVVLIGTNNIAQGAVPLQAAHGIYSIVRFLLNQINDARRRNGASTSTSTTTKTAPLLPYIVVVELLPQGYDNKHGHTYMPYLDETNTLLRHDVIPSLQKEYGPNRLSLVACGKEFIKYNYTTTLTATATSRSSNRDDSDPSNNNNYHNNKGYYFYEKVLVDKATNQTIQREQYETDEMLINKRLFMDLIHPNVHGHRILLQCIFDHLLSIQKQQQHQRQNEMNA